MRSDVEGTGTALLKFVVSIKDDKLAFAVPGVYSQNNLIQ
jgi:hypothetical protein